LGTRMRPGWLGGASATRDRTIVGIDVGTTKVCTLITEAANAGSMQVVGFGIAPSHGMRKGMVVDVEQVIESISASLEKAERDTGRRIESAFVSFTGAHITCLNNRGVIAIARDDRAISYDDVERAVEAAQVVNVLPNREIVHAIPRTFVVEGQDGVRNPVGMVGSRLDVEAHLITGAATALQNLARCVEQAGVEPIGFVLGGLAAADAVVTAEEREMGVALVDIGGGTTSVVVFVDGSPWHSAVIGVGGFQITNDIGVGLRTPFHEAEELKLGHGRALSSAYRPEETLRIATFGGSERGGLPGHELGNIIEARLSEIFQLVGEELGRSGYLGRLPAGIVLTGGTALLSGIAELGQTILEVPCRIGRPEGLIGLREALTGPAHATSVGLVLWGARELNRIAGPVPFRSTVGAERVSRNGDGLDVGGRLKSWLRAFLP
jgi:cell division protein FtsA